jgi:hypothetical protein
MATHEPTPAPSDDQGCIALVVPNGAARARKVIIPSEVAAWLRDELAKVLAEIAAERRAAR